ncbi:MAG TPA: peptide-methionine (S)-S-oxide reductase [Acidobacteriaceae bacterium]|nr:peptide-methionine (S)-S-oxide reductase [Acidobacteriaceae bacterium]
MMRLRSTVTAVLACTLSLSTLACNAQSETQHGPIPSPQTDAPLASSPGRATAVFAGGCFWGTQAVFERVRGVLSTTAGYSGGSSSTAHYDDVTTETTGHAESVEVIYDPSRLTYGQLLRVFFTIHDPTTLNRQARTSAPPTAPPSFSQPRSSSALPPPTSRSSTPRMRGLSPSSPR